MKFLLFLLIPLVLFSQNTVYPDTVVTIKGKKFPCLITSLNESGIKLEYGINSKSSLGVNGLKKIHFGSLGNIYEKETGFRVSIEEIEALIEKRNKIRLSEEHKLSSKQHHSPEFSEDDFSHFSFGAYYVPYTRSYFTSYFEYDGSFRLYQVEYNLSKMEAQFTYLFTKQFGLSLDLGFNSTYSKNRYESHYTSNYDSSENGEIETDALKFQEMLK